MAGQGRTGQGRARLGQWQGRAEQGRAGATAGQGRAGAMAGARQDRAGPGWVKGRARQDSTGQWRSQANQNKNHASCLQSALYRHDTTVVAA